MSYMKRQYEDDHPAAFAPRRERDTDFAILRHAAEWEKIWEMIGEEYDEMLSAEGIWVVGGTYYADHRDAHVQRMWEAERRVREHLREDGRAS